jgi:hypothetical protein
MSLLPQRATRRRLPCRFVPPGGGEVEQLGPINVLAHDKRAVQVKSDEMKDSPAKINADCVRSQEMPFLTLLIP